VVALVCETDGAALTDAAVAGVVLAVAAAGVVLTAAAGVVAVVGTAGVVAVVGAAGVVAVFGAAALALGDVFAFAAGDFISFGACGD